MGENDNLKGIIDINEIIKKQEIKPSFFQKCRKFYARMTTKSEGWLVSALQENEEGPKEKYVKFLVNKAHEKHEKIDKFFQIVFQFRHKINDNTVMNLKILNLLHIYL